MRFIDIDDLEAQLDPAWLEKAQRAKEELRRISAEDRADFLNEKAGIWGELKDKLLRLSYGKCWYCESKEIRSDNAVDHFRPKGNVRGVRPPHDGYWWLAFDWRNYRFACTFCNSLRKTSATAGGKQDYFPLWDEDKRARTEAEDLEEELPLLLDPTILSDVGLLSFSVDGNVGAAATDAQKREFKSADESIRRYHLKQPYLVESRMAVLRQVAKWVGEADKQLDRYVKKNNAIALRSADSRMAEIRKAASPKAEYSAAVRHLLAGMVSSEAAQKVLTSL